jgi:hypothetical protein
MIPPPREPKCRICHAPVSGHHKLSCPLGRNKTVRLTATLEESPKPLDQYLALEQAMLRLDAGGDVARADELRDEMDDVYALLSADERAMLNGRGFISGPD